MQADIYDMPFQNGCFDKIFCLGVLQHTPNIDNAFEKLPPLLKPGGNLVLDVYRKHSGIRRIFETSYWVRPFTTRIAPERLYYLVTRYMRGMWPIAKVINKIPRYGRSLNATLLIADYRGVYDLSEDLLLEWAILDTFDKLQAAYDKPQPIDTVEKWFADAGLRDVHVGYGYDVIFGVGTK